MQNDCMRVISSVIESSRQNIIQILQIRVASCNLSEVVGALLKSLGGRLIKVKYISSKEEGYSGKASLYSRIFEKMRLNLELKPKMIGTFKKIIQQLKKALMPQQSVYMDVTNKFITFLTEYDSKNLRNCNVKIQMGTEYFTLGSSILDSKREDNQIMFKILDFNGFAQNVAGLQENHCTVTMFLGKEGDNRYIKLKCTESDSLITQSRSEIKLNFLNLPFPDVDQKIFGMNIKSRDLSKLLDISSTNQSDLEMSFNIRNNGDSGYGSIDFKIKHPSIKVIYDEVKVYDIDENIFPSNESTLAKPKKHSNGKQNNEQESVEDEDDEDDYDDKENNSLTSQSIVIFRISQLHAKQISHICSIDEQMSICILSNGSLGIDFWEAEGPDNGSTIIAMKHFVVPKLDDLEYEEFNKMDIEPDYERQSHLNSIKVEEGSIKKKNQMYSDSDDNEDN